MNILSMLSGAGGTPPTYIEDVFSAYNFMSNNEPMTINNGINLTKGGMVWIKDRTSSSNQIIFDTVNALNGANHSWFNLNTGSTLISSGTYGPQSFSTTGFTVEDWNASPIGLLEPMGDNFASWTFRKAQKFFDIQTWTGNGATQSITHNLGITPGMVVIKSITSANNWTVWHTGLSAGNYIFLNSNSSQASTSAANFFGNNTTTVNPTSTQFTVGSNGNVNGNGVSYVAYIFAQDTSTSGLIQCGSFPYSGSSVTLGWEPQYILIKNMSATGSWYILDTSRGLSLTSFNPLYADTSAAEADTSVAQYVWPTATGFGYNGAVIGNTGNNFIYMAIRRGPMRTPTTGTSVFSPVLRAQGSYAPSNIPFAPDMLLCSKALQATGNTYSFDRLRGPNAYIPTNLSNAETTGTNDTITNFNPNGVSFGTDGSNILNASSTGGTMDWYFGRALGFFDVVCWTGNGNITTGQNISHSLGANPELILAKTRNSTTAWDVGANVIGWGNELSLNSSNALFTTGTLPFRNGVTSTTFNVASNSSNQSGLSYVGYLFASLPGISKIGTYTGDGTSNSSKLISCGFSPRFILIKRYDSAGDWWVFDTVRGITTGNDPAMPIDAIAVQNTTTDNVAPNAAGFYVNQNTTTNLNVSSGTYLFFAVA